MRLGKAPTNRDVIGQLLRWSLNRLWMITVAGLCLWGTIYGLS